MEQQVVEREGGVSITRCVADALGAAYTTLQETQAAAKQMYAQCKSTRRRAAAFNSQQMQVPKDERTAAEGAHLGSFNNTNHRRRRSLRTPVSRSRQRGEHCTSTRWQ